MKIKNLFLSVLIGVMSFSALTSQAVFATDYILKDYQETIPEGAYISETPMYAGSPRISAQLFTASSTYYANRVEIYLKRVGLPATYKIGIKAVAGGYPTGDYLAYEYIYANTLSTSYTWGGYDFTLTSGTWPLLTSGTQYALSVEFVGTDSNSSNYLQWRGTIENLYATGTPVYDTSPSTLWVTNTGTLTVNDLLFRIYGSSTAIPNTVTTGQAVIRQAEDGNFTVGFPVGINPAGFTSNVTGMLSTSSNFTSPISTTLVFTDNTSSSFIFDTTTSTLPIPPVGTLLPNTTYYYQGRATVGATTYYGEIKAFYTSITGGIPDKPQIDIIKIRDVSKNYNKAYVFEITAKISTTNTSDWVINQGIQFSINEASNGVLLSPVYSYNIPDLNSDNTYIATLDLTSLSTYSGQRLYFQAYIVTPHYGTLYSITIPFDIGTIFTVGGVSPPSAISPFSDFIKGIQAQLGMTGLMGTWAFMGLILLLIALVFGVAMLSTSTPQLKIPLGIIWALISITVIGAFLFTGELGVWPILILVGGVVVLVVIITSVKLSGSGGTV